MKRFISLLLVALVTIVATAQRTDNGARRSPAKIRAAVSRLIGAQRAESLKPVLEHEAISVLSSAEGGFAVVNHSQQFPIVLAYGDQPFDAENPSPELLYLLDLYEGAIEAAAAAEANGTVSDEVYADEPQSDESWTNISPMLKTKWHQGVPYYNKCPMAADGTTRCVTGCVATAMAQLLYFYKMPGKMQGFKTYGYKDENGTRKELSFDYAGTTFDWDNMLTDYTNAGNATQKDAVATLMLACGVGTGMTYGGSGSSANTWVGTDAINCFMDGLRAEHLSYDVDRVLQELKAGRPVIYSGANKSNGAHCFVIDGCNTNGYFHCNLGWGGSGDIYYLPTDMAGYAVSYQYIERVWRSYDVPTVTPMTDLQGKYATASRTAATSVTPGQWYVLWNVGRSGSPQSNGLGQTVTNTSRIPDGSPTNICAGQLIRFVSRSNGGYYIQTGLGDYFGNFPQYNSGVTKSSATNYFYLGTIASGYFHINSDSRCYMDTNGPGGTVVGWSTTIPTDKYSSSSWQLFPVTLSDTDPNPGTGGGLTIGSPATFNNAKYYTLKNTGYSQGYLVAINANDANPTLRGVTQNHSAGLYNGAAYRDAVDVYNEGTYWQIITENGYQYLYNKLTGKFLKNAGDKTCYVFTDVKTPINIAKMADGTYRFNTGTQAESFLCAATHLPNPAAFWTYTDAGSIWQVEEAEIQKPYVPVASLTLNAQSATLFGGDTFQLEATILPADASNTELQWTSSNAAVATVSTTGLVTAVGAGEAVITATSADNAACRATFTVKVYGKTTKMQLNSLVDSEVYLLCNVGVTSNRYCSGYLVAANPVDTDDNGNPHPTLRGVEVEHPTKGCFSDIYKSAPDFFSPYSYWQIFTDDQGSYLYNIGVGKFLTNQGDRTEYIFTDDPTPINIATTGTGAFCFRTGTDGYSYLCAATQLANPAGWYSAQDVGTYWRISAVDGIDESQVRAVTYEEAFTNRVTIPVETVTLSQASATLFSGSTLQLNATVLPANASNKRVNWTSSNTGVASVSASGLVTAVSAGEATITVASVSNPDVKAVFTLSVVGFNAQTSLAQLADDNIYVLRNIGNGSSLYCQGYLVATAPVAADEQGNEHPVLRGVRVVHPQHGCNYNDYKLDVDFTSPYTYWQIFSYDGKRYLYNIGVGKFLTNQGKETTYIFTDEPTPINIAVANAGSFNFNAGTDAKSFLCAATHLANPAAYWEASDAGSYWTVSAVEGFDLKPVDFFTAANRTIGHLVKIIDRLPNGEATLDDADRTKRLILHSSK